MIQIFATFEHSSQLELAISSLEHAGVKKHKIFAIPLSNLKEERKLFDSIHRSDGVSLVSKGAALGTAFAVIGASLGFSLKWGPIYWGLIGAFSGFVLGLCIDIVINKVLKKQQRLLRGKHSEVIIIVECAEQEGDQVEKILWQHFTLGVARINVEI